MFKVKQSTFLGIFDSKHNSISLKCWYQCLNCISDQGELYLDIKILYLTVIFWELFFAISFMLQYIWILTAMVKHKRSQQNHLKFQLLANYSNQIHHNGQHLCFASGNVAVLTSYTKFVTTVLQTWHGMSQLNTMRVQSMQARGGHSISQDILFFYHIDLHCQGGGGFPHQYI